MTTVLKPVITFRQSSQVEQSSNDFHQLTERKISTGYLERKTRHGSVISVEEDSPLSPADIRKERLIKTLKKEVRFNIDVHLSSSGQTNHGERCYELPSN